MGFHRCFRCQGTGNTLSFQHGADFIRHRKLRVLLSVCDDVKTFHFSSSWARRTISLGSIPASSVPFFQMKQIFNIPFRPFNGGKVQMPRVRCFRQRKPPSESLPDRQLRIPSNALFPDFFPSGLKLGFYRQTTSPSGSISSFDRPQHLCQGNKRNIDGNKLHRLRNIFRRNIADVGLFHADHPLVIAQLPGQLSVSHIHRIYLLAPFCSIQSVKPPVDAPTSMHTLSARPTPNRSMAFSSFRPPRLTYFSVFARTSMGAVSSNMEPALSSFCPST